MLGCGFVPAARFRVASTGYDTGERRFLDGILRRFAAEGQGPTRGAEAEENHQ